MKTYNIKRFKHYTKQFPWWFTFKNSIEFEARFDESCVYKLEGEDAYDINKLYGYSTKWNHHNQSARIGWRCLDYATIELFAYCYINGKRVIKEIDTISTGERIVCAIVDIEDEYLFYYKNMGNGINTQMIVKKEVHLSIPKSKDKVLFHYTMYPYFGGNKRAPHDMKIELKVL